MTQAKAATPSAPTRRTEVAMKIHTGMLESLGINMYTSIGKSLVEFIANGFDAEAHEVKLSIPFEEIEKARIELKARVKKEYEEGKRAQFQQIYEPLADGIEIVIKDNGHGMTVEEVEDKFLVVNRNRRAKHGDKSENGLRKVMGRKGLGKLAGFGVAEQVVVRTKRKGETYATTIVMDFNVIKEKESVSEVKFSPTYEEGLAADEQGTTITLKQLRCDSLKHKADVIENVLGKNFYVTGTDFKIYLNGNEVKEPEVDYEFTYPPAEQLNADGLATANVAVYEGFEYPILYAVRFGNNVSLNQTVIARWYLPLRSESL